MAGWPDHFPDGCPPDDAGPATGLVYRLVRNAAPAADDFRSHAEDQPERDWGDAHCKACGLSIFRDLTEAVKTTRRIPALRGSVPASAELDGGPGVILHTPSRAADSHHTWWLPDGESVQQLFKVEATA